MHAALCAAEGDVQQRGLPGHGGREAQYFLFVSFRMKPDAALAGPAGAIVLDPVTAKNLEPSVVHFHGYLDGHRSERRLQEFAHGRIQTDEIGGDVELVAYDERAAQALALGRRSSHDYLGGFVKDIPQQSGALVPK